MCQQFVFVSLVNVTLGISLAKEPFFSLALPDGHRFQIHSDVGDENLISHGVSRVPVIRARTQQRYVDVRLDDLRLLAGGIVVQIRDVVVCQGIVIVIVVAAAAAVVTMVAVDH